MRDEWIFYATQDLSPYVRGRSLFTCFKSHLSYKFIDYDSPITVKTKVINSKTTQSHNPTTESTESLET